MKKILSLNVLIFFTFKSLAGAVLLCNCDPVADSLALVELYNNTNGENWLVGWNLEEPMDSWHGVGVSSAGCVFNLNLNSNQLSGSLPDLNLPCLKYLSLNRNEIGGPIPNFSNLLEIQFFSIQQNQIVGSLPDLNLPNAEKLLLNENQISGSLPNFTGMPNLERLELDENQITGIIPDFSNLDSLTYIDLSLNALEGSIPDFSSLPQLENLDLQLNILTGEIPDFTNLLRLKEINLGINNLSGEIPDFELPDLLRFTVGGNNLSGQVPDFSGSPNLQSLRVSFNDFDDLSNLSSFEQDIFRLSAHRNQFTFEDILPNINLSNFNYEEQDSIFETTNINLNVGESYTIDLGIDLGITENIYEWFKDGVILITVTGDNKLNLTNVQASDEGVYTCKVSNPLAPQLTLDSRLITITISNPDQLALNSVLFDGECNMDSSGVIEINVINGIPPFQYQWSNGQSSSIIENLSDGIYSVTITDGSNQTLTQTFEINVNELLIPAQTTSDQFICQKETTLFANLSQDIEGIWSTTSTAEIEDPDNPLSAVYQLENGNNLFVWTLSTTACPDYDESTLSISLPLAPNLNDDYFSEVIDRNRVFDLFENDDLFSSQNESTVTFFDVPSNIELENISSGKFKIYPLEENIFSLEFKYSICLPECPDLCDTAAIFINYKQNIPSGITPNGDGLNDYFVIPFLDNPGDNLSQNQLIVFNRWGTVIYQQSPYMNNWNGTNKNGNPLPEGTYYFVLNFNNGNAASIKGDITILR